MFDWVSDLLGWIISGIKIGLCWFVTWVTDLIYEVLMGLLSLLPTGIRDQIPFTQLWDALHCINELVPIWTCITMWLVYVPWWFLTTAVRLVVKAIPTTG